MRDDIDRGLTGEKVSAPDPAAAPLGTDAEAGGAPPTIAERRLEAEARPQSAQPPRRGARSRWLLAAILVAAVMVVIAALFGFGLD
jgi:hypothetical protein